jgi:hypothetical protein
MVASPCLFLLGRELGSNKIYTLDAERDNPAPQHERNRRSFNDLTLPATCAEASTQRWASAGKKDAERDRGGGVPAMYFTILAPFSPNKLPGIDSRNS